MAIAIPEDLPRSPHHHSPPPPPTPSSSSDFSPLIRTTPNPTSQILSVQSKSLVPMYPSSPTSSPQPNPPPSSLTSSPPPNPPPSSAHSLSKSISDSQPSSLWKDLFSKAENKQKSYPPPSYRTDGTPVVRAPPEILLRSSEVWRGFLICNFFGTPPSPNKFFTDLNPIWGKRGSITVHQFSQGACLVFIPSLSTRKWVCDVGFWSTGRVCFSVVEWSPSPSLHNPILTSAPVWITLREVPPSLWSDECLKLIASGA